MADLNTTPNAPPVVYLGPSASIADIRAHLPNALIRPPARRGDLYRDRLLRYSVFVLIDGVFAQEDAISPREVVDVLRDGAAVIGASSMGALRAVDCGPAGAEGVGLVHRLFAHHVLNSEDEVAVLFNPDAPFPALSNSLVSMRVALHRAVRARRIDARMAARIGAAAAALHFSERSWRNAARGAGILDVWSALSSALTGQDVKRDDAVAAAKHVARRMADNPGWALRPRKQGHTFGLLESGRERGFELRPEAASGTEIGGFADWMLGSGRATGISGIDLTLGANSLDRAVDRSDRNGRSFARGSKAVLCRDLVSNGSMSEELLRSLKKSGDLEVEWLRYVAVKRAAMNGKAQRRDLLLAEQEIARAFGFDDWSELMPDQRVRSARDKLSRAHAWRRKQFSESGE